MLDNFNRKKNFWIEYGAAFWALIFALFHLVWAFGWYIGLDAEAAGKAFEQKWFLIYDLTAFALCMAAFFIALAFVRNWGWRLPPFLIKFFGWACALILTLRGAAAIVKAVYLSAFGRDFFSAISFWDLWFCLGAVLFTASIWRFHRQRF